MWCSLILELGPFLPYKKTLDQLQVFRWVRAILLLVPIHCIGTYNDIALTHQFVVEKSNIVQIMGFVFEMVEEKCGKRRKCWLLAISPFPTLFSLGFYFKLV